MSNENTVQIPEAVAKIIDSATNKAAERIIKHATNHGKIQRVLKTEAGEDVVVAETDFGADHVYQALARVEGELQKWKDEKWVTTFITNQINNLEAQKTKILQMKAVLEQ